MQQIEVVLLDFREQIRREAQGLELVRRGSQPTRVCPWRVQEGRVQESVEDRDPLYDVTELMAVGSCLLDTGRRDVFCTSVSSSRQREAVKVKVRLPVEEAIPRDEPPVDRLGEDKSDVQMIA